MRQANLLSSVLSALLVLSAADAWAQSCGRDADCPGALVCEAGTCVASGVPSVAPAPGAAAPAAPTAAPPATATTTQPAGTVRLRLAAPVGEDEAWTLNDAAGTVVCQIPCERDVPLGSTYTVRYPARNITLPVPTNNAQPRYVALKPYKGPSPVGPGILFGLGTVFAITGFVLYSETEEPTAAELEEDPTAESGGGGLLALGVLGTMVGLGGGIWLLAQRGPRLIEVATQMAPPRNGTRYAFERPRSLGPRLPAPMVPILFSGSF